MVKLSSILTSLMLVALIVLVAAKAGQKPGSPSADQDPQIGRAFQVPYRLTDTNHFLVRVRINGKGPFNFLVDSGAPALYVATETAVKVGLKPAKGEFWTVVDRLDLEGGARLLGIKSRVEDPFQLVGMNALGLPGASIDGILGFTTLARFRLEIDPTRDTMTWTRLNHAPPDPPIPQHGDGDRPPAAVQVMNALGPIAKGLAFLMGKQPEEERHPRGFLGLEWSEAKDAIPGQPRVRIDRVVKGSPAARADIQPGDWLIRARGESVTSLKAARAALSAIEPGSPVELTLRRGDEKDKVRELTLTITAGEGL
jgi:PDZ domain/Aspartyl protease